jgi:signal transduction histidine kinase
MNKQLIRVLLVDDNPSDVDLTRRALTAIGRSTFAVETAQSLSDAIRQVRAAPFDIVLLDLGLPDCNRTEALIRFREASGDESPIVVLTGLMDEQLALEALDRGAQDYIGKDDVTPSVLSRSIRYALARQNLLLQVKATNNLLAEKNARLAQLCDTAQQFVENVSHEFRTPLTVIREFTSIIRDGLDGPVTPKQAEHLNKVLHRTDDLALMVDDMLDISKLGAGLLGVWRKKCQAKDLVDNVAGLLKSRAASKQIKLTTRVPADLRAVFCDEEKARRVIMNLAVNAIKFASEGGCVEIWARQLNDQSDLEVGVTDDGPGISPENLQLIFERFRQVGQRLATSTKGFGLGLNIAKELVALNLGRINVESELGSGSTFSFTLPLYDPHVVFDRYLERLAQLAQLHAEVSLLSAKVNACKGEPDPVIDEFLQRVVRPSDLVMQAGKGRWIVAATCPAADCLDMVTRLTTEWTDFARNCPQMMLPVLQIQHRQTWRLADDRANLTEAFAAAFAGPCIDDASKKSVLVVDDDREVSQCLAVRLRSAGFDVNSAYDGQQGLDSARAQHPNAIVLDVRMPNKDGLTVLRELRTDPAMRDTPVVVLSASIHDQQTALQSGASYFVRKPYEADEVLSAIESSIGDVAP